MTSIVTGGKGNEIYGIEPDETRAELAKSRGINVFCGTLSEQFFNNQEPFDVVIFSDVLEHVADPAELLRLAAKGLKPGGLVLISVPNVAHWSMRLHLLRGRFDYTEVGIRDATHLRWFTLNTIQGLLRKEGFEVLDCKPTVGAWMSEYRHQKPWKWMSGPARFRVVSALTCAAPTLFGCQFVLKARSGVSSE